MVSNQHKQIELAKMQIVELLESKNIPSSQVEQIKDLITDSVEKHGMISIDVNNKIGAVLERSGTLASYKVAEHEYTPEKLMALGYEEAAELSNGITNILTKTIGTAFQISNTLDVELAAIKTRTQINRYIQLRDIYSERIDRLKESIDLLQMQRIQYQLILRQENNKWFRKDRTVIEQAEKYMAIIDHQLEHKRPVLEQYEVKLDETIEKVNANKNKLTEIRQQSVTYKEKE